MDSLDFFETKILTVSDDGGIALQILVTRTSIEVFGNDAQVSLCCCLLHEREDIQLELYVYGSEAEIIFLDVCELQPVWS